MTVMELLPLLLPLVCLCLLTQSGSTFADGNEPSVRVAVQEKSDVILPCSLSTKENIKDKVFDWKKDGGKEVFLYAAGSYYGNGKEGQDKQFTGRVVHFEDELKSGNASIKIKNTKMIDSGNYSCIFPNQQTSHIELIVGAVSEPIIKILETEDGVQLHCKVLGTSSGLKLNISLRDSSGTDLTSKELKDTERGGSYIFQTTVTKSGLYRCVATEEEIGHEVYTETFVRVPGSSSHVVAPWVVSAVLLIALLVTVG